MKASVTGEACCESGFEGDMYVRCVAGGLDGDERLCAVRARTASGFDCCLPAGGREEAVGVGDCKTPGGKVREGGGRMRQRNLGQGQGEKFDEGSVAPSSSLSRV